MFSPDARPFQKPRSGALGLLTLSPSSDEPGAVIDRYFFLLFVLVFYFDLDLCRRQGSFPFPSAPALPINRFAPGALRFFSSPYASFRRPTTVPKLTSLPRGCISVTDIRQLSDVASGPCPLMSRILDVAARLFFSSSIYSVFRFTFLPACDPSGYEFVRLPTSPSRGAATYNCFVLS